ncbi:MAG TPA: hypothetical protein VNV39_11725 [Stellaceae bacterium]|nr:hypothetical protein [Stellaceae bacterium]
MKLNSMKPAKISPIWDEPLKSIENEAIKRPKAQPINPKIWSLIRPSRSASTTAKTIPTISKTLIIADPLAARIASEIRSLKLRMWSAPPPKAAARIVGVKMPMP